MGGAIFAAFTELKTEMSISTCNFKRNNAAYGGAIHLVSPVTTKFSISLSDFFNNTASLGGGAIAVRNIEAPILRDTFFQNNSAFVGGAIFITNGGGLFVQHTNTLVQKRKKVGFEGNAAFDGGAIYAIGFGTIL